MEVKFFVVVHRLMKVRCCNGRKVKDTDLRDYILFSGRSYIRNLWIAIFVLLIRNYREF